MTRYAELTWPRHKNAEVRVSGCEYTVISNSASEWEYCGAGDVVCEAVHARRHLLGSGSGRAANCDLKRVVMRNDSDLTL